MARADGGGEGVRDAPGAPLVVAQNAANQTEVNKQFQRSLRDVGLYNGAIDGSVGPATAAAWQAFARAARVKIEYSPESLELLYNAAKVLRAPARWHFPR